jgi:hypothetical protein
VVLWANRTVFSANGWSGALEVDELDLELCTRLGAVIAERAALNQGFPSPPAPTRDVA